jgi:CDP-diglyceride synthetase
MDLLAIVRGIILVLVANGAPVLAHRILGAWGAFPIDFRARFVDGARVLGSSKTIRGVFVSIIATSLAAPLLGLSWPVGALSAAAAMAGDSFSSFIKRRLKLPAQSMAPGLDHAPECLLPLLVCQSALGLSVADVLLATLLFCICVAGLSRALFSLRIRERPY